MNRLANHLKASITDAQLRSSFSTIFFTVAQIAKIAKRSFVGREGLGCCGQFLPQLGNECARLELIEGRALLPLADRHGHDESLKKHGLNVISACIGYD